MMLFVYFSLAYLFSWLIWLPLYGPYFGLYGLPVLPFHHALGGLGPLVSALLTTYIFEQKEGLRRLARQFFQLRPFSYFFIALLGPFVLALIAAAGCFFMFQQPFNPAAFLHSGEFPQFSFPSLFLYNFIFFGVGEEAGWRGFALPRFQQRFNALVSSVILTLFWAVWHWPAFFYRPGYASMDMAGIFGWIFSLLTGSVLLTWLYNSSKGSILICAVFHSTIDIAFTSESSSPEMTNLMGFLITLWGLVTIFLFKPSHLSTTAKFKI